MHWSYLSIIRHILTYLRTNYSEYIIKKLNSVNAYLQGHVTLIMIYPPALTPKTL